MAIQARCTGFKHATYDGPTTIWNAVSQSVAHRLSLDHEPDGSTLGWLVRIRGVGYRVDVMAVIDPAQKSKQCACGCVDGVSQKPIAYSLVLQSIIQ